MDEQYDIRKRKRTVVEPWSQSNSGPTSTEEEEICLGTIISVMIQVSHKQILARAFALNQNSTFLSFAIAQEGKYFFLKFEEEKFARLNKQSCAELVKVIAQPFRLQAYMTNADVVAAVEPYADKLLSIEMNVYSSPNMADTVGRLLSKSHIFLQPPRYGLEERRYINPHILQIDSQIDAQTIESTALSDAEETNETQSPSDATLPDDGIDMDQFFDMQLQHAFEINVPVDRRIKSTLLQHQKEAISFISQRENEDPSLEHSLWTYNDTDEDEPFYQHRLNGERRAMPEEARGGILADEMGLGKSLVILSVIAGSLDQAEKFASRQEDMDSPQKMIPSQATLILAPSTLLIDNWVNEIRRHTFFGSLFIHKHIGTERHAERELLQKSAIVFTTYATLTSEYCRGQNTLSKIDWFRVVLDEAHYIRNRTTKQFQAAATLSAQHRWCLTGTPIQNGIEDLGALVAFLRVPILDRVASFRKFISSPITSNKKNSYQNLQALLQSICIRRTREVLNLPEPTTVTRKLPMSSLEKTQYRDLLLDCRTKIDMAVSGRRNGKINSTVLESLFALRLFCNNGQAVTGVPVDSDEALSYLEQLDQNTCGYCSGTIYLISDTPDTDGGIIISGCRHLVCRSCIPHHLSRQSKCPSCDSGNLQSDMPMPLFGGSHEDRSQNPRRSMSLTKQYPTKLLALLGEISQNSAQKCVVFSSWKKTLTLVAELLEGQGILYSMIEGSLSLSRRLQELEKYENQEERNVLLMTLGTGAVGLNLISSSRIYLLEPQWNPSIEAQAIGRALRLGQVSNVTIVRYIMEGTVEESNVLSRQRKKLQLTRGGFQKENNTASDKFQSLLDLFEFETSM